nr:unnamed protein product [Callosobruchus chinensis]
METDHVHGLIERLLKNEPTKKICTPWDWQNLIRSAGAEVTEMELHDFKNFGCLYGQPQSPFINKNKNSEKDFLITTELAENINLDQSDVDEDILSMTDSDDDQEDLIPPEHELATDICHSDNDWSSSDEEPLSRLIQASTKKWVRDKNVQPSKDVGTVTYDDHVKSPYEYLKKYINNSFFEDVATFTNMREESTKGHSLQTSAVEIQKD